MSDSEEDDEFQVVKNDSEENDGFQVVEKEDGDAAPFEQVAASDSEQEEEEEDDDDDKPLPMPESLKRVLRAENNFALLEDYTMSKNDKATENCSVFRKVTSKVDSQTNSTNME